MRWDVVRLHVATILLLASLCNSSEGQVIYGAQSSGNWSTASTWTPVGGPPTSADRAYIGTATPTGSALNATVTLSGNQTVLELSLGRNFGSNGTINLSGNTVFTQNLNIGVFGGTGSINHGGGHFEAAAFTVYGPNNFTFDLNDIATDFSAQNGGIATTASTGNITDNALVQHAGSTLNLGAALILTEDLAIQGTAGTAATLNANGHNITARDIYIGRFGGTGELLGDNQITATRDLEVSNSIFVLDSNDSVARTVRATTAGTLTLDAATAALNAEILTAGTINTVATSNISDNVTLLNSGSTLNMGAALSLSGDLVIQGTAGTPATVNANNHNITARDIYIGRFGGAGQILGDNQITATRDLEVSNSIFVLDGNDSVARTIRATTAGTLTLDAATAALNAEILTAGTINTVASSNISDNVTLLNSGSTLNMGAALSLSGDLVIQGTAGTPATVNANNHNITARDIYIGRFGGAGQILGDNQITATRDLEVSNSIFVLDGNDSVARTVRATNAGTLTLDAVTAALNAEVRTVGTINTVATSNISDFVTLLNSGSTLNMGAALSLSGDLVIEGTAGTPATVNANNHNITARDIYIGRFGGSGALLGDNQITATRDLEVSNSIFVLDGNDSVTRTVRATNAGTLTLDAATAALNAEIRTVGTINTVATSNISDFVTLLNSGSTLNMGAALSLSGDLVIEGTAGTPATVNANNHNITARDIYIGRFGGSGALLGDNQITATRDLEVSNSVFVLDGNDSVGQTVRATRSGILTLDVATAAQNAVVQTGGTIHAVATSNISNSVTVTEAGSIFNAGANVVLVGDMSIRGTNASSAAVDLMGNNLTANSLNVGQFANSGQLLNDGMVLVNNLRLSSSAVTLSGGNDQANTTIRLEDGSILTVNQLLNDSSGLTLLGNTLEILDTSILDLQFDNNVIPGFDWVFRWANPGVGNRVSALNSLIGDGRITLTAPAAVSVIDLGDGFTYIAIPEPSTFAILIPGLACWVLGSRRRRGTTEKR